MRCLVIDNSLSMGYETLKGSLLDGAKAKAAEFIDQLPAGKFDLDYSAVRFAKRAQSGCPPQQGRCPRCLEQHRSRGPPGHGGDGRPTCGPGVRASSRTAGQAGRVFGGSASRQLARRIFQSRPRQTARNCKSSKSPPTIRRTSGFRSSAFKTGSPTSKRRPRFSRRWTAKGLSL